MPKDELWQLCRAAYEQYQCDFLQGRKAYVRYVNDFISFHLPAVGLNDADIRLHFMHVCAIKELLEERHDLVEVFFSNDKFGKEDFSRMYSLFDTGKTLERKPVCLAHFSKEQLNLIANFVRTDEMFGEKTPIRDIKNLFECKLTMPIQTHSNRKVAVLFGSLCYHGLIPYNWQFILEKYKLISSSATNEPLRASQIRNALAQARQSKVDDFEATCKELAKELLFGSKKGK